MKTKYYTVYFRESFTDRNIRAIHSVTIPKKYQGNSKRALRKRRYILDRLHFKYCEYEIIVPESVKFNFLKNKIRNFS